MRIHHVVRLGQMLGIYLDSVIGRDYAPIFEDIWREFKGVMPIGNLIQDALYHISIDRYVDVMWHIARWVRRQAKICLDTCADYIR